MSEEKTEMQKLQEDVENLTKQIADLKAKCEVKEVKEIKEEKKEVSAASMICGGLNR